MYVNLRLYLGRLCAFFVATAYAASSASTPAPSGEPVVTGQRFQMSSKILGETRKYVVHTPPNYHFSSDLYPVAVLLDSEGNIQHVTATADFLANNGAALPMIVVGIENTDRQRDFTPPVLSDKADQHPPGNVGGAPKFLSFIADELIPEIDRKYRTRPTRLLIGHSYGGLFAIYALFNRPEVFKAYIAVSPSLRWDEQALAKQADQFVADHQDLQAAVYMTMGNEGGDMLGGAQKVAGSLSSSRSIGSKFERWPEETHGTVVLRSVYDGLRWLNEPFYTPDPMRVYEESGLQFFDKRYERISRYLGYEIKVPEHIPMEIQHHLLEQDRQAEALQVLQHVAALYPQSTGPHFELGKLYLKLNDSAKARAELEQTLKLYPGYSEARVELQKLGVDAASIVLDAQPPISALLSYVGEYRYADEASIVTLEGGKLFVHVGLEKRELRARSNTNFYAVAADREYTFQRKAGKVTAVVIDVPYFSYRSTKVR
jgi:predicted alpha/beta superfamily hydrolase